MTYEEMIAEIEVRADMLVSLPMQAIERVLQRDGCMPPGDPFGGAAVAQ